jgi:glutathione S-transferase
MKLYTGFISPNGKRVHVCATELGIDLELARLDLRKGENRSPDYLAINPMGKVPTLVDSEGRTLWESPAILCYLAQQQGNHTLWPVSARAQSDLLRWMFFGAQHIDSYFTTMALERFIKPGLLGQPGDAHVAAAAERDVARYLTVLEQQLAGKPYVMGTFSLADITLGTSIELAPMVKLDLAPYPTIRGWLERLQARPSWQAATAAATPAAA